MKKILLLLIIPISVLGQKPVRNYKFSSRKTGIFTSEVSVSPSGNLMLATFTDFAKLALYELISLKEGKVIAKGSLDSKPLNVSWSDDDKIAAISFTDKPPACFDVAGNMKKMFECRETGAIAFTKNTSILPGKKDPVFLYVFGAENIYKYSDKGVLVANYTIEGEDYNDLTYAWFNPLSRSFKVIESTNDEIQSFDLAGQKKTSYPTENIELINSQKTDKDGALYLYNDDQKAIVYNANTGKKIALINRKGIAACTFTPDSKTVLVKIDDSLCLYDMKGRIMSAAGLENYYSDMFYAGFGTELICINPEGVDIYACKNYMPVYEINHAPGVKNPPPPVKVNPPSPAPVTVPQKPVPEPAPAKWNLPYTMTDFIVPFQMDSFYLYSPDGKLRNYIKYEKGKELSLWKNTYNYFQYFGFSNELKFAQLTTYILELTNGEAIIHTYAKSGIIEKPAMLGMLGYLAKIPPESGKSTSWPMKIYADDQYTLSAKIIDNTYRGKKDKCLTVTREDFVNGKISAEVNFYQKGVGLIKTEVNGNIAYQR